tara:strand:- start:34 stop:810 length:777 start_codon:yes stop_codon:yes gene_type:complete
MKLFNNCVVIAQARPIKGKKVDSHICSILWDRISEQFIRITCPFSLERKAMKRWDIITFLGDKDNVLNNDTRKETWGIYGNEYKIHKDKLTNKDKNQIHKDILKNYAKYDCENKLNKERKSIGILIPNRSTIKIYTNNTHTEKEIETIKRMKEEGIYYSDYNYKIAGKKYENKYIKSEEKYFDKTLVARDIIEAERQNRHKNINQIINNYKNPYIVIGNTPFKRNTFVAIGILSAPEKYIEDYALETDYQAKLQIKLW